MKQKIYNVALSLILGCFLSYSFQSCSDDDIISQQEKQVFPVVEEFELSTDSLKASLFIDFAKILSKVTFDNKDVRKFLQDEALTKFDYNNDVLWLKVREENIGGKTFKQILESYSSPAFIESIEENIPLLNILFPELFAGKISAETYDVSDVDLPVVLLGKNGRR